MDGDWVGEQTERRGSLRAVDAGLRERVLSWDGNFTAKPVPMRVAIDLIVRRGAAAEAKSIEGRFHSRKRPRQTEKREER